MKKNVRKALAISGLAITIGAAGMTLNASANTDFPNHINRSHQERIIRTKRIGHWGKMPHMRRVIPGTVTAIGDNSLTITHRSKTFTVNVSDTTRLLDLKWATILFSDIKVGDRVRVLGTLSDTSISAKTVRDISIQ
jgi:hypothetical protein